MRILSPHTVHKKLTFGAALQQLVSPGPAPKNSSFNTRLSSAKPNFARSGVRPVASRRGRCVKGCGTATGMASQCASSGEMDNGDRRTDGRKVTVVGRRKPSAAKPCPNTCSFCWHSTVSAQKSDCLASSGACAPSSRSCGFKVVLWMRKKCSMQYLYIDQC